MFTPTGLIGAAIILSIGSLLILLLLVLRNRPKSPPPLPPTNTNKAIDVGGGPMFRSPPHADNTGLIAGIAIGIALQSAISSPSSPASDNGVPVS